MPLSSVNSAELTATQVQKFLIQPLERASVFLAAGPRIFDTDGNAVRIPKLNSMPDPSFVAQNTLIPETDPDFGEVTLLPTTMQGVKSLTRFSNELARQSVLALDAALRDVMVRETAAVLDTAFIASTTTDGTRPTGLLSVAGTQQITGAGAVTIDRLHDAVGLALAENVDLNKLRWFVTSRDFVALRKLKDTSNRYQLQPDPTKTGAFTLLGYPVTITNRIPQNTGVGANESAIILADFSQIAVARDIAPSVKILDQTFGDFDQMAVRVTARYDMAPMNAKAVVIIRGITP